MKNLKYVALILMLFIGIGSVDAQIDRKSDRDQEQIQRDRMYDNKRYNRMQKELSLTDDQMKKAEDIQSKRVAEIRKLREQIRRLKEEERKEMHSIYTPEQREKLKKLEDRKKEQMRKHRGEMNKKKDKKIKNKIKRNRQKGKRMK